LNWRLLRAVSIPAFSPAHGLKRYKPEIFGQGAEIIGSKYGRSHPGESWIVDRVAWTLRIQKRPASHWAKGGLVGEVELERVRRIGEMMRTRSVEDFFGRGIAGASLLMGKSTWKPLKAAKTIVFIQKMPLS